MTYATVDGWLVLSHDLRASRSALRFLRKAEVFPVQAWMVCGNLKKVFRNNQLPWRHLEIRFDTERNASHYQEIGVFLFPTTSRALSCCPYG